MGPRGAGPRPRGPEIWRARRCCNSGTRRATTAAAVVVKGEAMMLSVSMGMVGVWLAVDVASLVSVGLSLAVLVVSLGSSNHIRN
jgi:hypothetical protein